jgi:hypothetical protein
MHEEEKSEEYMPDRSDFKSVPAGRLGAFFDVHSVAASGEIDWPLNTAVRAASEP